MVKFDVLGQYIIRLANIAKLFPFAKVPEENESRLVVGVVSPHVISGLTGTTRRDRTHEGFIPDSAQTTESPKNPGP